jgi:hypothetical protein
VSPGLKGGDGVVRIRARRRCLFSQGTILNATVLLVIVISVLRLVLAECAARQVRSMATSRTAAD